MSKLNIKDFIDELSTKFHEYKCIHDSGQKHICKKCIRQNLEFLVKEVVKQTNDR